MQHNKKQLKQLQTINMQYQQQKTHNKNKQNKNNNKIKTARITKNKET